MCHCIIVSLACLSAFLVQFYITYIIIKLFRHSQNIVLWYLNYEVLVDAMYIYKLHLVHALLNFQTFIKSH